MPIIFRDKGLCDYQSILQQMIDFTQTRTAQTTDEVWLLQHYPVYTLGTSCKDRPDAKGQHIGIVKSNRGGQITYHGPGQLIVYLLMDIKRLNTGPRSFVQDIEQLVIDTLQHWHVYAQREPRAPGVYVNQTKIAALGLRISKGCCYHGFSINVNMDLQPFDWINPCGFKGQKVSQLKDLNNEAKIETVQQKITQLIERRFS